MQYDEVWELVDLLEGFKPIGVNGYKTKKDSKGRSNDKKQRLQLKD